MADAPISALAKLYRDAILELKERARKTLVSDAGTLTAEARRAAKLQREAADILRQLDEDAAQWIAQNIPENYLAGVRESNRRLRSLGAAVLADSTVQPLIHQQAVQALVNDMQDVMEEATRNIERSMVRVLRRLQVDRELDRLISRDLALGIIEGKARREVSNEIAERLVQEFGDGPIRIGGRRFSADSYAELVARTKTREAASAGTIRRMVEVGNDLVVVSAHGATDACGFYEGKVFSISGTSEKYPSVREMPSGGPPFHPNCRHVLLPFVEEAASEADLKKATGVPRAALGKTFPEVNRLVA